MRSERPGTVPGPRSADRRVPVLLRPVLRGPVLRGPVLRGGVPRGRARRVAAVIAAAAVVMPLAGCGLLGAGTPLTPAMMTISSGAFAQNTLPQRYTCDAAKPVSPPLSWSGAPPGTKSIALVVDDSSAPITPQVYWIVFDISPETSLLQEGQLPPGARQAQNSMGQATYDPPCPQGSHVYRFTVYALSSMLNLPSGTSLESAWMAIAAATIGRARATPTAYSTPPPG